MKTQSQLNILYLEHGFKNRKEYLSNLADEYGVDFETVVSLAHLFGPNEDFDGLINALEEYVEGI